MNELKDIPGFEGRYAATRDGRIWSYIRRIYLRPKINRCGYSIVVLYSIDKISRGYKIARLISATYLKLDLSNPNITVDHINGDKLNDSVENLRLLSMHENLLSYHNRLDVDTKTHKMCSKCKEVKIKPEFAHSSTKIDGYGSWCKLCKSTVYYDKYANALSKKYSQVSLEA